MEPTAVVRRHPALAVVATLSLLAVVGVVAATRGAGTRPPLVLAPGGGLPAEGATARYDPGAPVEGNSYRYQLATALPDFGASAPVARLAVPALGESRVRTIAVALGLRSAVQHTNGGWSVTDGPAHLTIEPTPGGWSVAYDAATVDAVPGSVPGSTGSAGSSGSSAPGMPVPPPVASTTVAPPPTPGSTTFQAPPHDLPAPARAEQTARALLVEFGIADASWSATATDSSAATTSCAPQRCPQPYATVTTRTVVLSPTFDSRAVDGIAWQVELGDNDTIASVSGTWTTLHPLGRYPLRSVKSVFADLVAGAGTSPDPVPVGAPEPAPGDASPDYAFAPLTAAIDRITLGYAATPARADGVAVVDIVPTYVFSGHAGAEVAVTRSLVAVESSPLSAGIDPGSTPTVPNLPAPPVGQPEPQPAPGSPPTASGTAPR